jgi:hypothetical protein
MNVVGSGKLTKTDDVLLELGRAFDAYLKSFSARAMTSTRICTTDGEE